MLSPVLGTVQEFIGYAIWIVGLLIVYYIGKFIFVAGPPGKTKKEKKAEEKRLKKESSDFWTKRKESKEKKEKEEKEQLKKDKAKKKEKTQKKKRKRKLKPIMGFMTRCIEESEEAKQELNRGKIKRPRQLVKEIKKNLTHALTKLRKQRTKMKDIRDDLNRLAADVEAVRNEIDAEVIDKLKGNGWAANVGDVITKLSEYAVRCDTSFKKINQLIKG
mgnify:CR=1 FL=1|tara:strand:- start:1019 stop:1672 length:654 start_codon:yes stop_codon:yes gene_type:complete